MNKFLGSNIALIIGVLALVSGLTNPSSLLVAGPVIILGTLSYKSAKKRKFKIVKDTPLRKTTEIISLVVIFFIIFLQTNVQELMYQDPVPNLLIPMWVLGAYLYINFSKSKQEK